MSKSHPGEGASRVQTSKIVLQKSVSEILEYLKDQLLARESIIDSLQQKVHEHECAINADSRVKELTEEVNSLKESVAFSLTSEERERIREWKRKVRTESGAIGGQFEYRFRPTMIGTIIEVTDGKNTLTVRDLSNC